MAGKMKDSGVEWIGEIPEEWNKSRFSSSANVLYGYPADSAYFGSDSRYIPLIRIRDITSGLTSTYYEGSFPKSHLVKSGDVLIGMDGDFNVRTWEGPTALLNQRCCKVWGSAVLDTRYLSYCLPDALRVINDHIESTTVKHLLSEDISKIMLPLPAMKEQIKIADYLDSACLRIDAAISTIEKEIDVLERYKASLIHETVTKGLNPNAPMKDSGIEWIGEIPEGWEVKRIKDVVMLKTGQTPPTDDQRYYLEEVDWFTPSDTGCGSVTEASRHISFQALKDSKAPAIPHGSVLLVCIGATAGKSSYLAINGSCNQQITALIPLSVSGKYLSYVVTAMQKTLRDLALYTTLPILNNHYIGTRFIPAPSASEQDSIAAFLDGCCSLISTTCASKQKQLDLLKRQRQSLIYEYVTGKKRVPGYGEEA